MVCGFSCEDLISMFKELKSLGVVVKELSNELRQLVREESRRLPAGCMRLPVCPSLRVSVGQLLPCAVSACVCTCPTQSQTHTEFSAVFQMLHHHTQKTDKWTKQHGEAGLK